MSALSIGRMQVEAAGSGSPVVLLHGLGGTSNTFQPQMPVLSGFRALRPDLPGSGRSPLPGGVLTLDRLVAAVADLCTALDLPPAHFVAHSMGTLVCQHLAVQAPQRVRSLTLFGGLLEPPDAARDALRQRAVTARTEGMQPVADAIVAGSLSGHTRAEQPAAVAFVRESLLRQPAEAYAASCEALAGAPAAEHSRIRCPCLLITGEDDAVTPAQMARQLSDRIKRARLRLLPRIGHWAPVEAPQWCNRLLQDFLHGDAIA